MRMFLVAPLVAGAIASAFPSPRSLSAVLRPNSYDAIRDPIGRRLEAALGIKVSTTDFTSPYANAMAAYLARSPQLKDRVRSLVRAIMHGACPLSLYRIRVRVSNVAADGRHLKDARWHYGSPSAENALAQYILSQAMAMRRTQPAPAARYAKAALVCFHANYFDMNDALLGLELIKRNVDFDSLAGLSQRQRRLIRQFYSWRYDPKRASTMYASRVIVSLAILQSRFVRERRVGAGWLSHFLQVSSGAMRHPNIGPILLRTVLAVDWQVLNVARRSGDQAAKRRLIGFFEAAKGSGRRPWVRRWAGQALREKGPMPVADVITGSPAVVHPARPGADFQHH